MNVLVEKSIQASDIKVLELFAALEPTWYQKYDENRVLFFGIETNPRKWVIYSECDHYKKSEKFAALHLPENDGGRNRYLCKHYQGTPRGIVIEKSCTDEGEVFIPVFGGRTKSLVFTNPYGVCKCHKCKKVFSTDEAEKNGTFYSLSEHSALLHRGIVILSR